MTLKEIQEKYPDEWKMFCDDKKNRKGMMEYRKKQEKAKREKMFEEHKEVVSKVKGVLGAKEGATDGPEKDKDAVADADRVAALEEQLKLMVRIHQESEDERVALQFAREQEAQAVADAEEARRQQDELDEEAAQQAEL